MTSTPDSIGYGTQSPNNGGEIVEPHIVIRDDSNGPGGSSVLTDPSLGRGPSVEMIPGSDMDEDDRY